MFIEKQSENFAVLKDVTDKDLWISIRHYLSYTTQVFFRGKPFNQVTYLIHGKTKQFPVGLIPLLQKKFGPLQVVDTSKTKLRAATSFDIDLSPLEEHQRIISKKALELKRCIIALPTGSGKSFMISYLANNLVSKYNLKVVIVVPSVEILNQISKNINKDYLGYIWGNKEELDKQIILTTGQTLHKRYDQYAADNVFQDVDVLIADEAHYLGANSFFKISFLFENSFFRLGFSSTPKGRSDNADLRITGVFSPEVLNVDESMIDRIVPLKIMIVKYQVHQPEKLTFETIKNVETYDDLLGLEDRFNAIQSVVKSIEKQSLSYIIFVDRLAFGQKLATSLDIPFANAGADRKRIFTDLKEEKIQGCVSTIGKEGLDIPNLDCIINTSIIHTSINLIQKAGRVRRKTEDKYNGLVVDFYDTISLKAVQWTKARLKVYKKIGEIFYASV